MKIISIIGGLGNQMFQYAFAKAVQAHNPDEKVYIDALAFNGYGLHNGYEMASLFKLDLPQARKWDITRLHYPIFHYKIWQVANHWLPVRKNVVREKYSMVFQPEALTATGDKYYDGYWQSYKYFEICKDEIRKIFTFPEIDDEKNLAFAEELKGCNCVSVHVRRGDYLTDKDFGGITTETYYKNAIKKINELTKPEKFVVFSNDLAWCKEKLTSEFGDTEVVFVDWNKGTSSFRDIQLMSLCKHNIVANSSFSWWGAWLNRNEGQIVIAPAKWKNVPYPLDMVPEEWIKVSVE